MVTFLFTDIEGSTRRWEDEPAAMRRAQARHEALIGAAVDAGGGRVFKTVGDALYAAFDEPVDALRAAVTAQRALLGEPWPTREPLRVRMALHRGPAEATDGDYLGSTLNRAARVLGAAHGAQVLATRAVAEALPETLPDDIALRPLGRHRLRDVSEPVSLLQVMHPSLPAQFPPLRALDEVPHNLPRPITRFVGRETALAEVQRLLGEASLVTLTGVGGAGKTRLALEAARALLGSFLDGVWWVELATVGDADRLALEVAQTLGLRERPVGPPPTGRPAVLGGGPPRSARQRTLDYLADRQALLVLDNCEHLVTGVARFATEVLEACPNVRVLVTSREALGVGGEVVYHVPPLAVPAADGEHDLAALRDCEAVRLFVDRATAALPEFELTADNAPWVVQVCQRLDGIPLAIELAAVRVKVLTVEALAKRLDDRFQLLTGGSRTALPRQQTLRATMDWSYGLLDAREQVLFRRVAVFAGGFTLEAAEDVCADGGERDDRDDGPDDAGLGAADVLDLVTRLVDKSLLTVDENPDGVRYRQLETIRQYAQDRLLESGESPALRHRHREWCVALVREAAPLLRGGAQGVWLDRLEREHDNLRAALAWSLARDEAGPALQIMVVLWWFWFVRGYLGEGRAWLDRALELAATAPPRLRAQALLAAGAMAWRQRDYETATARLDESLSLFWAEGDDLGAAHALIYIALAVQHRGRYGQAMDLYRESLSLFRAADDRWGIARALELLGSVAWLRGDHSRAAALLERSLELSREIGNARGVATVLNLLGRLAQARGDLDRAAGLYRDSVDRFAALGDPIDQAYARHNEADLMRQRGDYERARALYEAGLDGLRRAGDQRGVAYSLAGLANVARDAGEAEEAAALYGRSLAQLEALDDRAGVAQVRADRARLALAMGDDDAAKRDLQASLELATSLGDRLATASVLTGLALVQAERGRAPQAVRLLGAAEALREEVGGELAGLEWPGLDARVGALREALGSAAFEAARDEGRALGSAGGVGLTSGDVAPGREGAG